MHNFFRRKVNIKGRLTVFMSAQTAKKGGVKPPEPLRKNFPFHQ